LEYLLGIDAGTTSFKGAVFDRNGNLVASAGASYELITSSGSVVEFTAGGYLDALKSIITELLSKTEIAAEDIVGMSIDSQGETLIMIDNEGAPLCNAIVWLDSRADSEAAEISAQIGVKAVYDRTGQPEIAPTWPASKLLWVRKNRPDLFNKVYKVLLLEDYLIYILTGKFAAEKSLLTSTIYYDINKGCWWDDMLDFVGINESQLPEIYNSGEPVARVVKKAAEIFGLSEGTMVVTGALDQLSGMIGSGVVSDGSVCETTGTCMAVCVNTPSVPAYNPHFQIPCHAGVDGRHFYQIYWSQTAGAVLEWFKNNFYKDMKGSKILKAMDEEAAGIPAGAGGITALPHLSGKACPEFNADARGAFFGIKLMHGRGHFTRAILESVAFMLREHIETAESQGIYFNEIRSLGGGAKSPLWNQMKADVTGKSIVTLKNDEATCLGTAILAGRGTGLFKDINEAAGKFVRMGRVYEPDINLKRVYDTGYEKYKKMYELSKGAFGKNR